MGRSHLINSNRDDFISPSEDHAFSGALGGGEGGIIRIDFWTIIHAVKKWWWFVILITAMIVAFTALAVFRMTPVYMATSVLEIKQKERQIFNASEVENFIVDNEFFDTQVELLKSGTLAENIVDSLNLVSDVDFVGIEADSRDARRRLVTETFSRRLKISPVGRSRLIRVSFEHTNPGTAARVANAVADTFISFNMERKYNATSYARDFIEERLRTTKKVLEKSERDLVAYASENELVTVRDAQGNVTPGYLNTSALISLDAELTSAQTRRSEYEQRYKLALKKPNITEVMESKAILDLKGQRLLLNSEYMEKLTIYKPEFPDMLELQSRIDFMTAQIEGETQHIKSVVISDLELQYQVALKGEKDLRARVNVMKASIADIRDKSIDYNILKREVDTNRTQYDALLQRLKEVSVSDEIGSNLISLVDHAKKPTRPFKPNKLLALLLAAVAGTALGSGLVFAIELIDDRIKSPDDIKNKLKTTVMGVIPRIQSKLVLNMLEDPQAGVAEAYSSLRTNLQFSGPNGGPRVIHVTSTRSGEGKSVSSLGLALRFAGLNEKVLLIDADMRLPTFLEDATDGQKPGIGLSGLLTSSENPGEHIRKTKYNNLDLLASGKSVPNPSEILSTYRLKEVLDYARDKYDHIIVDSPPVMGIADAPILAASCDVTIIVVEYASIRTPAIRVTMERLLASGAKVLGVVLTKYKAPTKGYLNYYQYSYGNGASQYGLEGKKGKKSKTASQKQYIDIF
jgi:capsular exopolysaccharide synthesis family protein